MRLVGFPERVTGKMEREDEPTGFRKELVSKLFQLYLKDVRVGADALALAAELLNVFVQEAAARAARQAQLEELPVVDLEHIEKILPQLLLDF